MIRTEAQSKNTHDTTSTVVVATAFDESFAMPAAVMLRSLVRNLREGIVLKLFLMENGVSDSSKKRIDSILTEAGVKRHWLTPSIDTLTGRIPPHHNPAAYFRLLLPDLVPECVKRIVYLDADLIVLGDLAELWEFELGDALVLASCDAYGNEKIARLKALEEPGLPLFQSQVGYFNSGVMLINLAGWRVHAVGYRSLELVETLAGRISYYEQDALNLVLNTRWNQLPGTWNFHEMPHSLDSWEWQRYPASERAEMFRAPKIVHFIYLPKPWEDICVRSHVEHFHEYLALTPWRHWQPRLEWHRALLSRFVRRPHERLRWYYWRLRQSPGWDLAGRLLGVVLRYPWTLLSVPLALLLRPLRRWSGT